MPEPEDTQEVDVVELLKQTAAESVKIEMDIVELLKTKYPEATVHSVAMPLITLAVMFLARAGFAPQQTLNFLEAGFTSASMRIAMEAKGES